MGVRMLMDQMAAEERSHTATWPRVALATCAGLKSALGKSGELWGHSWQPVMALGALYRARGENLPYVIQVVPRPQPEEGQLPGEARRSRNRDSCQLNM